MKPISTEEDFIKKSTKPFIEIDDKEYPFGKVNDDGIFEINYNATSRYGYSTKPIYGIYLSPYRYRIFVGECPHKNENDEWITYNDVPNFIVGPFGGSSIMQEEPDFPHIIHIETEEIFNMNSENRFKQIKELEGELYKLRTKLLYCSFGAYIKGLWERIKRRFGKITYYKGERVNQLRYSLFRKSYSLIFAIDKETKSVYLWQDTNEWWRFLYFKKDGKWCLKYEKQVNYHEYTSC